MMAEALIKYETIDAKQIAAIMQGKRPRFVTKPNSNKKRKVRAKSPTNNDATSKSDDVVAAAGGKKSGKKVG